MKRYAANSLMAAFVLIGFTACHQQPATTVQKTMEINTSPFKPVATLQELMTSVVDPNIDPIWNSVSTVSTKSGTVEKVPQSEAEWTQLKQHALTLIEVSNLLVIEGRPVAAPGVSTSTHPVELSPADIQKTIEANRPDFIRNAHAFQEANRLLLKAIQAKNVEDLVEAGGVVEKTCEQCHSQFWYPNDKRPTVSINNKVPDKKYPG